MGFPATTRHYSCISLLMLIAVVTTDVSAATPLEPPGDVVLIEESTTSFSVTWNDTASGNVTYDITVSFSNGTSDGDVLQNTMSPTVIDDKTPGQTYYVNVTAVRGQESADSAPESITLSPSAVTNLEEVVDGTNSSSVTASWQQGEGIVTGYRVSCSNGTAFPANDLSADQTSASCNGDIAGETDIAGSVVAVTVESVSNPKLGTPETVRITAVPNPVDDLFEVGATMGNVTAGWIGPSAGVFDGYVLSCSPGSPEEESLSEDPLQVTCSTTEAGQVVVVSVSSTSDNKTSDVRSISITAFPGAVEDLRGTNATTTSVTVGWVTPDGTVDSYTVECMNGPAALNASIGNDSVEASCGDVTPGSLVTVRISSMSGNKSTPAEQPVRALPNAVEDLQGSGATTSSVSVTWDRPVGELDQYDVYCSADTTGGPDGSVKDGATLNFTCKTDTAGDEVTVTVVTVSGGEENSDFTVVRALPNAVDDLQESGATTSSVLVTWNRPAGVLDQYDVYCSADTTESPDGSVNDGATLEFTCMTGTAGEEVTVTVVTVSGGKENSDFTVVRALPSAVDNLQESGATTSSVSVTWDRPVGKLDRYNVYCSADTTGSPNGTVIDGATLEYTCAAGIAGDEVTVTVVTVSGGKNNSDFTVVRVLPNAVNNLQGSNATTSSVSVTWNRPMGELDQYDVYCSADTTGKPDGSVDNEDPLIYTCPAGTAGDEVTVTVVTVSGDKNNSAFTVVRARPNAVRNLREFSEDTTSVTAAWNEPVGIVSYYIVGCSSSGKPQEANVTDLTASCVDLETPGADYTMTVTSYSYGVSGASENVTITAQPSKPFLTDAGATNSSITVQWNWNSTTDGEVDFFEAQCDNGTTLDSIIPFDEDGPYEVVCEGLTPGGQYSVFVNSVSNEKPSQVANITVTAVPAGVALTALEPTVSIVGASWSQPSGRVDRFRVECSKNATPVMDSIPHNESKTTYEAFCNVPVPGKLYNMMITPVRLDDSGGTSEIDLRALPRAVESLEVSDHDTDSVDLTWDLANQCRADGCQIGITCCVWDLYDIIYATSSGGSPESEPAGLLDTSKTVGGLIPGEEYYFSVVAISDKERSAPRNITQRTVPEAVKQLTVHTYDTTSVELTWVDADVCTGTDCTDDNPCCVWDSYQIEYYSVFQGGMPIMESASKEDSSRSITGLTPGDEYNFTITAVSGNQWSDQKAFVQRTTPEAVKQLTVPTYDTTSVELTWVDADVCTGTDCTDDNPCCVWDSYQIEYYSVLQGGMPMMESANKGDSSRSITGLTPGDEYNFTITTVSGNQLSDQKAFVQRTEPEAVDSLTVKSFTTSEVDLRWNMTIACEANNCDWTGFRISYLANSTRFANSTIYATRNEVGTGFTGLIPGEEYTFAIIVESYDEDSLPVTEVQRLEPEPVGSFTVQDYSTTNVNLVWAMSSACDGEDCVWSQFVLSYTTNNPLYPGDTTTVPKAERTTQFKGLIPGEEYRFKIIVESGEERSVVKTRTQRTIPESVKNFSVLGDYTTTRANLEWAVKEECEDKTGCVWDRYLITYYGTGSDTVGGRNETYDAVTATFDNLKPGDLYNFSITVFSYEQESLVKEDFQRMRPAEATGLAFSPESRQIVANWVEPDLGLVTGYDVTIRETDSGNTLESQEVTVTTATFEELTPGVSYTVSVCTRSEEQSCIVGILASVTTIEERPSKPQEFTVGLSSNTSVDVQFSPPAEPNGIIISYTITYIGTGSQEGERDGDSEVVLADERTEREGGTYETTIEDLRSGYTYSFEVYASNSAGKGSATEPLKQKLEETLPDVPVTPVAVPPEEDRKEQSFRFSFSSDLFSDCNGRLKSYSVLVIPNSAYDGNDDDYDPTSGSEDPDTPAHSAADGGEYKAISRREWPFESDYSCGSGSTRKRRQSADIQNTTVIIGDGSTSPGGFTNVKLQGGTGYHVKIRAWNDAGYSESPYSEVIITLPGPNPLAWIIPLVIILILVIVAGGLVWRERQKPGKVTHFLKSRTSNKANGGIDNHAFDNDRPMRRTGDDRPVRLGEFAAHLEEMSKDADYLFSEEYSDLRPIGKNQASKAAELDENKVKNRFSNILPYDHTRVNLDPSADEPGSDYINANYMIGYDSPREYIACQGPLQNTEEDMWRMVWEQGASLIVMVTQLMEKGKIKCHQYWPEEGEGPVQYGEITVRPLGKELTDLWVIRKFIISRGPVTREVLHFNFVAWRDHGVPDSPEDLIKFVREVRQVKKRNDKPMVVHCSAGVGRTGTFISLDTLMTTMEQEDEVDIFGLVRKMRMNRCAMVQTETQYIFIHECINALLEGASEVIYENQNGTPTEENIYYNEALI